MALETYDAKKLAELEKWFATRAKKCSQIRAALRAIGKEQLEINHKERVGKAKLYFGQFFDDAKTRLRVIATPDVDVDEALD